MKLLQLINGFQASQAIHIAATLELADLLNSGPMAADALAAATNTHPASLYRLMRALAAIGILHEAEDQRFALTALGEHLRGDVSGTCAPMAVMIGQSSHWHAWDNLLHAVRYGDTAFEHIHGSNVWDYRARHPQESHIFDHAMASGTLRFAEAVLAVHDFSVHSHVVDVGGGDGAFLGVILAACPSTCGTLFDQPHVIMQASPSLKALGDRCRMRGGNFFVSVPDEGDAYLLKWILHDWDDTAAIDILRTCRRAMPRHGRLLVVEHVVGPPNTSPDGKFMDLNMMVMTGGQERTRAEFAALFAAAGFRLLSVTPTTTPLSLIEGVPAPG